MKAQTNRQPQKSTNISEQDKDKFSNYSYGAFMRSVKKNQVEQPGIRSVVNIGQPVENHHILSAFSTTGKKVPTQKRFPSSGKKNETNSKIQSVSGKNNITKRTNSNSNIKKKVAVKYSDKNKDINKGRSKDKENDMKNGNENLVNDEDRLNGILNKFVPRILKSLAFTNSNKPNNKIYIKNKYAELFN